MITSAHKCSVCFKTHTNKKYCSIKCAKFAYNIKHRYKIDINELRKLYLKANGRCEICKSKFDDKETKINVDHCHKSGKIRGLLCLNCNHALGKTRDSIRILKNAIRYLRRFKR